MVVTWRFSRFFGNVRCHNHQMSYFMRRAFVYIDVKITFSLHRFCSYATDNFPSGKMLQLQHLYYYSYGKKNVHSTIIFIALTIYFIHTRNVSSKKIAKKTGRIHCHFFAYKLNHIAENFWALLEFFYNFKQKDIHS